MGAGAEAWAAYLTYASPELAHHSAVLRALVWFVVPFNVLGGTFYAYPGLVKKALQALKAKSM